MLTFDIKNSLTTSSVATPASRTATLTTSGVDLRGYIGPVQITQHIGVVSGTSPTWDGTIEDSADNSSFAAVSGLAFTQVTASTNLQTLNVDTRLVRRYIRYVGTIGGSSTPTFNSAVTMIGQKATI